MTGPGHGSDSLRAAVEARLAGARTTALTLGVERLRAAYRSGEVPRAPVLSTQQDVIAYAAYRMPATEAAAGAALQQVLSALPEWAPGSLVDVGAGTGATVWAAAGQLPNLTAVTLLEQSQEAIDFGRMIFRQSGSDTLRQAAWHRWRLPAAGELAPPPLPAADVVTASYVLGELSAQQQEQLVELAVAAAPAVVLVEPGTPAGYRRIIAARAQLLASGLTIVAPCPHQLPCPLTPRQDDWCHFAERVERSAVHRRAKGVELSYEDEKFSFVAAIREPVVNLPGSRVIRRPQQRKGLVSLELCVPDGSTRQQLVGKRHGPIYRQARKLSWGDRWDPTLIDPESQPEDG